MVESLELGLGEMRGRKEGKKGKKKSEGMSWFYGSQKVGPGNYQSDVVSVNVRADWPKSKGSAVHCL